MSDTITIDGVGPMPVERPTSAADVSGIVRRCASQKTAIYPFGGGTMLDYGLPPAHVGVAVDLRALDKVIDFPARDMTITVEAGMTLARLNEIVQAEKLQLPIDVPEPEKATIGGAIACNVSGPRRYGYGTFRDYVLGITTVNDRGELVLAGGRVVKNVAGYDMMKLHTGALGTLGIITQVTLRLKPLPEAWASLIGACPRNRLVDVLDNCQRSSIRPIILNFSRWEFQDNPVDRFWNIVAGFEGRLETVDWQIEQLKCDLQGIPRGVLDGDRGTGALALPMPGPSSLEFKASIVTSTAVAFADELANHDGLQVRASCAGAIVRCAVAHVEVDRDRNSYGGLIRRALDLAAQTSGNLVVERCPREWKKSLPVWGRAPADLALQKTVKRALDPNNIFNPGRFVTDAF